MKNQRDLIRPAHIEMIPDHAFKPHPARLRPVEHAGIGNLELSERHLIPIPGAEVGLGEGRRQTPGPAGEKALHGRWAELIADLLQRGRITAGTKSVIQGFIANAGLVQLPFGPLMTIEPQPDGKGRIGVGLPERPAPFRIPDIEIEMIDEGHLATPVHVRVAGSLLPFPRPRSPHRRLLLRGPDQHYPVFALARRRFQVRTRGLLFVLTLLEMHDRNAVKFGKLVDRLDVSIADPAERSRGGNGELPLPAQERAYVPHRLKLRYIRLQEDAVERTAAQRHVIPE